MDRTGLARLGDQASGCALVDRDGGAVGRTGWVRVKEVGSAGVGSELEMALEPVLDSGKIC